jgi:hypothetical protein
MLEFKQNGPPIHKIFEFIEFIAQLVSILVLLFIGASMVWAIHLGG